MMGPGPGIILLLRKRSLSSVCPHRAPAKARTRASRLEAPAESSKGGSASIIAAYHGVSAVVSDKLRGSALRPVRLLRSAQEPKLERDAQDM